MLLIIFRFSPAEGQGGEAVKGQTFYSAVTSRSLDISHAGAYMISSLKKRLWIAGVWSWLAVSGVAWAQSKPGTVAGPMPVDSRIWAALREVSAERIRANIEKLASFGTRSTLSAQDAASIATGRGIGAAREWIKSEFERYGKEC